MVLTPADVHNVAFSKPRIGKRGYDEQEVDMFIDLVEQELIRHLHEEDELRNRCAEFRNRFAGLQNREAELAEREAALSQHESEAQRRENELRKQEAQLEQRAAQLANKVSPLPQQVAQLRHREAQVAQREAELAQHQAQVAQQEADLAQREDALHRQQKELGEWEADLRRQEAALDKREDSYDEWEDALGRREDELRRDLDQQKPVPPRVDATGPSGQAPLPLRQAHPLGTALVKPAAVKAVKAVKAVNGSSPLEQAHGVAAVHGRHDMERMAIRAVTDTLGNTVTETVHERTRRSAIETGAAAATLDASTELDRLRQENAELTRSLGLLKSAAALLAAALEHP
jgi:DivIVA domain-containing protein